MKTKLSLAILLVAILTVLLWPQTETSDSAPPQTTSITSESPRPTAAPPTNTEHEPGITTSMVSDDGSVINFQNSKKYPSLDQALSAARRVIKPFNPSSNDSRNAEFFCANPGQQLRAWFSEDGIELASSSSDPFDQSEPWSLKLRLSSLQRGSSITPVSSGVLLPLSGGHTHLEIQHHRSHVTQWFNNKGEGIEQGFTVQSSPDGLPGELRLLLEAEGTLQPRTLDEDAKGIRFADADEQDILHYAGLKAWDADGRDLPATMELQGHHLALVINDTNAKYPLTIDPLFVNIQTRLSERMGEIGLGSSVALDGDIALIGAPYADTTAGEEAGSVFVFARSDFSWNLQLILTASNGTENGNFGTSLAVDGDTVLIGADSEENGRAYIFTRSDSSWTEQAILSGSNSAPNDRFGWSVSLDGDTALIGAPNANTGAGEDAGRAYIFTRSGTTWNEQATLKAIDSAASDAFGTSVALDGDKALVGAPDADTGVGEDAGSAYLFTRSGPSWTQTQQVTLTASASGVGHKFGSSVALDGDTALVGASYADSGAGTWSGSAYLFTRADSSWPQRAVLTASNGAGSSFFGSSVALDGDTALIGAPFASTEAGDSAGSAYLFTRSGPSWTQTQQVTLTASDGGVGSLFGSSVALDGDNALIGSPDFELRVGEIPGKAYLFNRSGSFWDEETGFPMREDLEDITFGSSVAISDDTAIVGVPGYGGYSEDPDALPGIAYVFIQSDSFWSLQAILNSNEVEDQFGDSVALEGDRALVGAPYGDSGAGTESGIAFLFTRSGSYWTEQAILTASDSAAFDLFGSSVALSGDHALVGAPFSDPVAGSRAGSAYVFTRSGTSWPERDILTASNGLADDQFGSSVALDGEFALVGAPYADTAMGIDAGRAYIFTRSGLTSWPEQTILTASNGSVDGSFGFSVALDNDRALIGAPDSLTEGTEVGKAYLFTRFGSSWSQEAVLIASNSGNGDLFGWSVALDGNNALIGATESDSGVGQAAGSAYIFSRSGSSWAQQAKLTSGFDTSFGDLFGWAVDLNDNTVVVGAARDRFNGFGSGSVFTFLIGQLPEITEQPLSQIVPDGNPVELSITATGYETPESPLRFQWRKNNAPIDGATSSSYSIPSANPDHEGFYDCVVSNVGGTVTSSAATLSINTLSEFDQEFSSDPPPAKGYLLVTISPPGVHGAWRFQGEQSWRRSGIPLANLTPGDRIIEFRPVPGYIQPPAEAISIVEDVVIPPISAQYYLASSSGTGSLTVFLKPDDISFQAQWRFLVVPGAPADPNNPWRNSGDTASNLPNGTYLIECKDVSGRTTPSPAAITIDVAQPPPSLTLTYFIDNSADGTREPAVIPFETVSTAQDKPYHFVGQLRTSIGSATGFAVKPRVVLTAAHVLFDEANFDIEPTIQWLPQRDSGFFEPLPLTPRGFIVETGYARQRKDDDSPGEFSFKSRTLDAAALYFDSDAARGSYSGWLASDLVPNEWLTSSDRKTLVGYPVEGVPASSVGRMHATPPEEFPFTQLGAFEQLYVTTEIRSYPGNSGGPLCIQFTNISGETLFYPAGIYLGGKDTAIVRSFDLDLISLINDAQTFALDPGNGNTSVGRIKSGVDALKTSLKSGGLEVIIEPEAARNASAKWGISPAPPLYSSHSIEGGLTPETYTLEFSPIAGFETPTSRQAVVTGGKITPITVIYNPSNSAEIFKIDSIVANATSVTLTLHGKKDRRYQLQRWIPTTPNQSPNWEDVGEKTDPLMEDDPALELTDPGEPSEKAFYRVIAIAP